MYNIFEQTFAQSIVLKKTYDERDYFTKTIMLQSIDEYNPYSMYINTVNKKTIIFIFT